jgi:ElaB/YqjD/DUF883 family membrane-anchored ribosome-binding protein
MYTSNKDAVNEAKTIAGSLKRDTINTLEDASSELRTAANKAGRKVRKLYDAASNEISDDLDIVAERVRNNPVQSAAIALGVGFILGALLRR